MDSPTIISSPPASSRPRVVLEAGYYLCTILRSSKDARDLERSDRVDYGWFVMGHMYNGTGNELPTLEERLWQEKQFNWVSQKHRSSRAVALANRVLFSMMCYLSCYVTNEPLKRAMCMQAARDDLDDDTTLYMESQD